MKKMPAGVPLFLCACFALTSAHAQQWWRWTGDVSPDWSDTGNWTINNSDPPISPNSYVDLIGHHIILVPGTHWPLNQNIDNMVIGQLNVWDGFHQNLVITNKAFTLNNGFRIMDSGQETHIKNDITFNFAAGEWSNIASPLRLFGTITENGSKRLHSASGQIHFHGPVFLTDAIGNESGGTQFYGVETTGAPVMDPETPFYFYGNQVFNFPNPQTTEYVYDFTPGKSIWPSTAVTVQPNMTVLFNGPIAGNGASGITKWGAGILELNAATNHFTGPFGLRAGLVVVQGALTPGTGAGQHSDKGSIDFNGVDYLDRALLFYNGGGVNDDGVYRNQNPECETHINGNITSLGDGGNNYFGGVGDILFSGDILDTNQDRRFNKVGAGTLTMTGTSFHQGPATVFGGTLVLDYGVTNSSKLAEDRELRIAGNLVLRGNGEEDTVQTVGPLVAGIGDDYLYNRIRIAPEGRHGKKAVFRFASVALSGGWQGTSLLDFAPGEDGEILALAQNVANNPNFDAISAHMTFRGESYASVSGTVDGNGYSAIEAMPDTSYSNGFALVNTSSFVDVAGDADIVGETRVAALRFNDPNPATLTLHHRLNLYGENGWNNGFRGGILVTPRVGANDVVINSENDVNGILCFDGEFGTLAIHQYNTNAALTINAQILRGGGNTAGVMKTGPGELVLTNPENSCTRFFNVYEGTVTVDSVANAGEPSTMGRVGWMLLGDATFKYTGPGHGTDRQVVLRGFGTLDASGTGPLVFTSPSLIVAPNNGKNQVLTLSGGLGGEGVIEGRIDYGSYVNSGRLRKRGEGTWTFAASSTNALLNGAEIFNGTLVLDGSFGRDVTVHAGGTLEGSGRIKRNLIIQDGGTLSLDPGSPMTVGKNLILAEGAVLKIHKNIPGYYVPLLYVEGNVMDEFYNPPPHASYKYENGVLFAKLRPVGTLFLIK